MADNMVAKNMVPDITCYFNALSITSKGYCFTDTWCHSTTIRASQPWVYVSLLLFTAYVPISLAMKLGRDEEMESVI
jgi:hypothetical protein